MIDIRTDVPADVRFLFQDSRKRVGGALGVSLFVHTAVIGLAIFIAMRPYVQSAATSLFPESLPRDIVWYGMPGPGGGGGGGGNRSPEPARKAELIGNDKITVPVAKPLSLEMNNDEPPPLVQNLTIPVEPFASANLSLPGVLDGAPPASQSQGSGNNGGAGTGTGPGIGPGSGSGLGPGLNSGTGSGPYRPGNGVETPRLLKEVKPLYTSQAMRAKIQGTVLLECVVQPDGSVGNIKVVRSLDATFGLDQEAMKAARQWQFAPGTRFGQPVPVLVTIQIAFTLR